MGQAVSYVPKHVSLPKLCRSMMRCQHSSMLTKLKPTCTETHSAAYQDVSSCSGDGFAPDWPWTDWARRWFDSPSRYSNLCMSLEQSLSHVNSLPRYIGLKFLRFSIACPSIFTLASFSSGFFSKDFFVFTTFICIPYHALSACNLSTVSCNFSLRCSIISMLSANLRLFTRLPWTPTPLFSLFLISVSVS